MHANGGYVFVQKDKECLPTEFSRAGSPLKTLKDTFRKVYFLYSVEVSFEHGHLLGTVRTFWVSIRPKS